MTTTGTPPFTLTVGVLALQGAFAEHIKLLRHAAAGIILSSSDTTPASASPTASASASPDNDPAYAHVVTPPTVEHFNFIQVRTPVELDECSALIIPGGESTSISLIAERTGLLEPLRQFVKVQRKPVWGTCAGLILLAESANKSKATGQELIGGLDVRVLRNYFGRQVESFEAALELPLILGNGGERFHSVFIRAPVVESVIAPGVALVGESEGHVKAPSRQPTKAEVEVLGRLPGRARVLHDQTTTAEDLGEDGDIVVVRQGNVFGTAFHPELTGDPRIHGWWLREVLKAVGPDDAVNPAQ